MYATGDITRRLLVDAGIGEGMRVLDIGCGYGEVTLLAAALVGAAGQVLGVDRAEPALQVARTRAREQGVGNVSFSRCELDALPDGNGLFDAVIGRRVLMYVPDAVATLSRLAAVLKPGGLIVLQEHDPTAMPLCRPAMPLHEQVHRWIWETVAHEGADVHMGLNLSPSLRRAGFTVECVRAETTLLMPGQPDTVAAVVRAIVGRIVAAGAATEAAIGLDTLEQRLVAERVAADGTCVWELVFAAWARKAGDA